MGNSCMLYLIVLRHGCELISPAMQFKDMLKATDNPQAEPGKPISAAFEPHMGIFVDAQDKYAFELKWFSFN
jgi:hypothetical protein